MKLTEKQKALLAWCAVAFALLVAAASTQGCAADPAVQNLAVESTACIEAYAENQDADHRHLMGRLEASERKYIDLLARLKVEKKTVTVTIPGEATVVKSVDVQAAFEAFKTYSEAMDAADTIEERQDARLVFEEMYQAAQKTEIKYGPPTEVDRIPAADVETILTEYAAALDLLRASMTDYDRAHAATEQDLLDALEFQRVLREYLATGFTPEQIRAISDAFADAIRNYRREEYR